MAQIARYRSLIAFAAAAALCGLSIFVFGHAERFVLPAMYAGVIGLLAHMFGKSRPHA